MAFDAKKWLKEQEQNFESIREEAKQGGFTSLPDSKYTCRLSGARFEESSNGRPQIHWIWTVIEGEYTGEQIHDFDGLEREDAMLWILRKLRRLEVDLDKFKPRQLFSVLESLVDAKPAAVIQLKTTPSRKDPSQEYQNASIFKYLGAEYESEEDDSDDEEEEEETSDSDEEEEEEDTDEETDDDSEDEDEETSDSDEEDEDEDDEDEEQAEPEVGMAVQFERKGKVLQGVIAEIPDDEDDTTVKVKVGTKVFIVELDDLQPVEDEDEDEDDEEEDEEPAPVRKPAVSSGKKPLRK